MRHSVENASGLYFSSFSFCELTLMNTSSRVVVRIIYYTMFNYCLSLSIFANKSPKLLFYMFAKDI